MYGMGGIAKNTLKNVFTSKIKTKQSNSQTHKTNNRNNTKPLGYIEKPAASRSLITLPDGPISYIPPRIKKTDPKNNNPGMFCLVLESRTLGELFEQLEKLLKK